MLIASLEAMSSFRAVLAVVVTFISTGQLVEIVLLDDVSVDGDVDGIEGGRRDNSSKHFGRIKWNQTCASECTLNIFSIEDCIICFSEIR